MLIILSLNPENAEAILSGRRKCEFVKETLPDDVNSAVMYSRDPEKKIVGLITIRKQEMGRPEEIWAKHANEAGMSEDEFNRLYKECDNAVCLEIESAHKLDTPIDPHEKSGGFAAPRLFRYVSGNDYSFLTKMITDFKVQKHSGDATDDDLIY